MTDSDKLISVERIRKRREAAEAYREVWNDEFIATEYLEAENQRLREALIAKQATRRVDGEDRT